MDNFDRLGSFAKNMLVDENSSFDVVYDTIMQNQDYFRTVNRNPKKKLKIIDKMIAFYESKENYEKCADLIEVKKEIQRNVKSKG